jgi:4-hydroxy-tetrahydrodipicolinate reductase
MRIVLYGACGRMGRQVVALAGGDLAAALEHHASPDLGRDAGEVAGVGPLSVAVSSDLAAGLAAGDVLVDFSVAEASPPLLDALEAMPLPSVVAVTGLTPELGQRWRRLSERVPVLLASNLSLGAAVLRLLAARAARALAGFDVEVVETHHRMKADAPSGTALDIVRDVAAARDQDPGRCTVHGRRPGDPARETATIGVHAVRGGTVAGEHEVRLLGEHERLCLHHSAESRAIFARGALDACGFVLGREPGLYCVDDVVGEALRS